MCRTIRRRTGENTARNTMPVISASFSSRTTGTTACTCRKTAPNTPRALTKTEEQPKGKRGPARRYLSTFLLRLKCSLVFSLSSVQISEHFADLIDPRHVRLDIVVAAALSGFQAESSSGVNLP